MPTLTYVLLAKRHYVTFGWWHMANPSVCRLWRACSLLMQGVNFSGMGGQTGESGISPSYLFIIQLFIYRWRINIKPKSHIWLSHLLVSFLLNYISYLWNCRRATAWQTKKTRNKSNAYFEALQYRQDLLDTREYPFPGVNTLSSVHVVWKITIIRAQKIGKSAVWNLIGLLRRGALNIGAYISSPIKSPKTFLKIARLYRLSVRTNVVPTVRFWYHRYELDNFSWHWHPVTR